MKTETAARIVAAIADALQRSGIDVATLRAMEARPDIVTLGMDFGKTLARQVFGIETDSPQPLTRIQMLKVLELVLTDRQKLIEALQASPEPSAEEMATTILERIETFRKTVLPMFREAMMEMAKRLPHSSGGRPRKIPDAEERVNIRAEVAKLVAGGYTAGRAKERVAAKNGISLATVRRICREPREKEKLP